MFYGCPNNNKVHFILPSPWILETNDSIKGCGQIPPWADTPLDKMAEVLGEVNQNLNAVQYHAVLAITVCKLRYNQKIAGGFRVVMG